MPCFYKFEPVFIWCLAIFVDDELAHIAAFQRAVERRNLAIHLRLRDFVANFGVNGVTHVDRRGIFGKIDHIALWREHKNAIAEHVELQLIEMRFKIVGVQFFLNTCKLFHPLHVAFLARGAGFVAPVRCHTVFAFLMHFLGANLELQD